MSSSSDGTDSGPPVRTSLVERIKLEIGRGVYETPQKVAIDLEGLAKDLSQAQGGENCAERGSDSHLSGAW